MTFEKEFHVMLIIMFLLWGYTFYKIRHHLKYFFELENYEIVYYIQTCFVCYLFFHVLLNNINN